MSKLSSCKTICFLFVFCAVMAIALPAQTFTTLVNFNLSEGYSTVIYVSRSGHRRQSIRNDVLQRSKTVLRHGV